MGCSIVVCDNGIIQYRCFILHIAPLKILGYLLFICTDLKKKNRQTPPCFPPQCFDCCSADTPVKHKSRTHGWNQCWLWRCSTTAAVAICRWALPGSVSGRSGRRFWRPEPRWYVWPRLPPSPALHGWKPASFQRSEPDPPTRCFVSPHPADKSTAVNTVFSSECISGYSLHGILSELHMFSVYFLFLVWLLTKMKFTEKVPSGFFATANLNVLFCTLWGYSVCQLKQWID